MMIDIKANLNHILQRIRDAQRTYHRSLDSVNLLVVSKTHPPSHIAALNAAGQQDIGENYVQEALSKISALSPKQLTWHFIGPIQTNKAGLIAQNFNWVHTVYRFKEAQRLSTYRPARLGPLNICVQVKLDEDPKRGGAKMKEIPQLIREIQTLPLLRLRGLMTLPPYTKDFVQQRHYFRLVKNLFNEINVQGNLDTLSMGMTHDLEAAIAEGATMVRVGTGIFGPRNTKEDR